MNQASAEEIRCSDCNEVMTQQEVHWYDYRCEDCEQEWHKRVLRWKAGMHDAALDRLYQYKPQLLAVH